MRRMLLVCLALLGLSGMTATALAVPSQSRIIGGSLASPAGWPAIAAVVQNGSTPILSQFCGGTLIDPSWILTAAHCTFNGDGTENNTLDAWLAAWNFNDVTAAQPRDVDQVVRHPGYVDDGTFRDDVALLHLASPVNLGGTPSIQTMDLVSPLDDAAWDPGSPASVAGWGLTIEGDPGSFSNDLLEVGITMLGTPCGLYGASFVPSMMLCAAAPTKDSCQGDSGGPLTVPATGSGQRVLVGAVSWGTGCAQPNFPGIYSHLPNYRQFIYNTIGVVAPSAPQNAQGAITGTSATVSWQPPAAPGGRPIVGYEIRASLGTQIIARTTTDPATFSATLTGLSPGVAYTLEVYAASAAGLSPAATASQRPLATGPPSVAGRARVRHTLTTNTGVWVGATTLSIQWQACDTTAVSCVDIPGATGPTYAPTALDVGKPLKIVVTGANAVGVTSAVSTPSTPVRAAFAVTRTRATRATPRSDGSTVVSLGLRTDRMTKFQVRVLDPAGRILKPRRTVSRFDGRVPALVSNRLIATLAPTETHTVNIGVPSRAGAPLKTVRIVIRATSPEGDRVDVTFRARVRL